MTFGIKFLYCKHENLCGFLNGTPGHGLRFSDIYSYIKLENKVIADDESKKSFTYDKKHSKSLKFKFNNIDITNDIKKFTEHLPTRRCHTLCLSNIGDSDVLFSRFKADLCIGIDVDLLLEILNEFFRNDIKIIAKNVEYYGKNKPQNFNDFTERVFYKGRIA